MEAECENKQYNEDQKFKIEEEVLCLTKMKLQTWLKMNAPRIDNT